MIIIGKVVISLLTDYKILENKEERTANVATFIEVKVARLIHRKVEDETMISLYYSLLYSDGSIPFTGHSLEEYQRSMEDKK